MTTYLKRDAKSSKKEWTVGEKPSWPVGGRCRKAMLGVACDKADQKLGTRDQETQGQFLETDTNLKPIILP